MGSRRNSTFLLLPRKGRRKTKKQRTTLVVSSTGGCNLNTSWTIASKYGRPVESCSHVGSVEALNWESSSRSLCCLSGRRQSSIRAHYDGVSVRGRWGREGQHTVKLTVICASAQWGEEKGEREGLLEVVS